MQWRRGRDSNSWTGISRHTISNRAPSANSDTSPQFIQEHVLYSKAKKKARTLLEYEKQMTTKLILQIIE